MKITKQILIIFSILALLAQTACGPLKPKKTSAKDFPPDPRKRVQKNIEEGKGFRLMGGDKGGTNYEFANIPADVNEIIIVWDGLNLRSLSSVKSYGTGVDPV